MPLCGSTACGCALSSAAATSAAINGYYPTIGASGAGTAISPWVMSLDTDWATEVADHINDMAWTSFSPSIAGLTIGTGSQTWVKRYIGDRVEILGNIVYGSTTVFSGDLDITIPDSRTTLTESPKYMPVGQTTSLEAGVNAWWGFARVQDSTTIRLLAGVVSANQIVGGAIDDTNPLDWATSDELFVNLSVPLEPA